VLHLVHIEAFVVYLQAGRKQVSDSVCSTGAVVRFMLRVDIMCAFCCVIHIQSAATS